MTIYIIYSILYILHSFFIIHYILDIFSCGNNYIVYLLNVCYCPSWNDPSYKPGEDADDFWKKKWNCEKKNNWTLVTWILMGKHICDIGETTYIYILISVGRLVAMDSISVICTDIANHYLSVQQIDNFIQTWGLISPKRICWLKWWWYVPWKWWYTRYFKTKPSGKPYEPIWRHEV